MTDSRFKIVLEIFLAWGLVIAVGAGWRFLPAVGEQSGLALAVALLYIPIGISFFKKKRIHFVDDSFGGFFKSLRVFAWVTGIVLGLASLFVVLVPWFSFVQSPDLGQLLFQQIFVIALPEEFFFRGYLQERLKKLFPTERRFLGASVGAFLILTSLIFALSHSLITLQWWHPLIFFPSLVFGWLKEKTGTITAPILFHAACNVFSAHLLIRLPF